MKIFFHQGDIGAPLRSKVVVLMFTGKFLAILKLCLCVDWGSIHFVFFLCVFFLVCFDSIVSGLKYNKTILPNSPYKTLNGAIIQAWRKSHWASWMFEVDSSKSTNNEIYFDYGGFQGARGGTGQEFFIENVFEEVDYATEYFFNESTNTLYFVTNGSESSDFNKISDITFEVTQTKILFQLRYQYICFWFFVLILVFVCLHVCARIFDFNITYRLQDTSNIVINGMNFGDSAHTYLDDHGMPSGGDWALQYSGCIFLRNTTNITISKNNFTRLDGNGIFLYGYNEDITINNNEFIWNGDTAIALWGQTQSVEFEEYKLFDEIMTMGVYDKEADSKIATQPTRVNIIQNYCHELGIFEKQSSFYFQAKSQGNIISYNIFYNGPRAGINFNDGFGGGSKVYKNLLFNTCRESSDHGMCFFCVCG